MGHTTKKLIADPEVFITELEGTISKYIDKYMEDRSAEWANRGDSKTIRSSTFGTCIRRAYYDYFTAKDQKVVTDRAAKERMFMGFLGEELMERYFTEFTWSKEGITGHTKQNEFPVHLDSPNNTPDIKFAATTDFVHEIDIDGVKYYIPMELKTTQISKWFGFRNWKHQLLQLMTWIYIGKELNLNIPYGVLVYTKDLFSWYNPHQIKVNLISVDTPFRKTDRIIEDFNVWKHYLAARRQELIDAITTETLPAMPTDVPTYICNDQCPFKNICYSNINYKDVKELEEDIIVFQDSVGKED